MSLVGDYGVKCYINQATGVDIVTRVSNIKLTVYSAGKSSCSSNSGCSLKFEQLALQIASDLLSLPSLTMPNLTSGSLGGRDLEENKSIVCL